MCRYDLYNDIRQSRNAAGNERPTSCPATLPPGRLSGVSPFHFHPGCSPAIDGSPSPEDGPWMSGRFIDLSVRRAAFTYPSPPLPPAHTPRSFFLSDISSKRRSPRIRDPLTDCDPSSLILLLSSGYAHRGDYMTLLSNHWSHRLAFLIIRRESPTFVDPSI